MTVISSIFSPDGIAAGDRQPCPHGRHRAGGFSLIELMVAMLLAMLVLGALVGLFISSRRAYQLQSNTNFLQENMRLAADRISWSLRMADFWGGFPGNQVVVNNAAGAVTGVGSCNASWVTAINSGLVGGGGIYGYSGGSTFPPGNSCLGATADYLPGSDVLVVRHADSQTLSPGPINGSSANASTPAESSTIAGNPSQLFVLAVPGTSAQLFTGASVPTTLGNIGMHRYAYAYAMEVYYLRPCSLPNSAGDCTATSDNGMPLPTLMRMRLQSNGQLSTDPVVDGIEQLKFAYGVLNSSGGVSYLPANQLSAAQWPQVSSVLVSLVAVNPSREITIPHTMTLTLGPAGNPSCQYTINNGSAPTVTGCSGFTPYGGSTPWQFVRTSQQFVVQLRNRAANLGLGGG